MSFSFRAMTTHGSLRRRFSERERVFEPFVRLEQSPASPKIGVGLGLALVRRIVIQHGGSVNIMTSLTGGCRVRTTWPSQGRTIENV